MKKYLFAAALGCFCLMGTNAFACPCHDQKPAAAEENSGCGCHQDGNACQCGKDGKACECNQDGKSCHCGQAGCSCGKADSGDKGHGCGCGHHHD